MPTISTESKKSKAEDAPQSRSRIFASSLARKLAEIHNVSSFICCSNIFSFNMLNGFVDSSVID
ncbi:hypothetical protein Scep_007617 [Stephania cephalantha]|uniref:Uncharacterized protein n=1 Tax=Stephania cephalantha TaxID=152367 RepID=A0AAP0KCV4_9MAGN